MKLLLGKVTEEEKLRIRTLNGHINGLEELLLIIERENPLYQKLTTELTETKIKYQEWWDKTSSKYNWSKKENSKWEIQFESCEIYLITPD